MTCARLVCVSITCPAPKSSLELVRIDQSEQPPDLRQQAGTI